MWSGFDPELRRQLDNIRQMVALRYQTPTRECPCAGRGRAKTASRKTPSGTCRDPVSLQGVDVGGRRTNGRAAGMGPRNIVRPALNERWQINGHL